MPVSLATVRVVGHRVESRQHISVSVGQPRATLCGRRNRPGRQPSSKAAWNPCRKGCALVGPVQPRDSVSRKELVSTQLSNNETGKVSCGDVVLMAPRHLPTPSGWVLCESVSHPVPSSPREVHVPAERGPAGEGGSQSTAIPPARRPGLANTLQRCPPTARTLGLCPPTPLARENTLNTGR